jgi:hypothetical protein
VQETGNWIATRDIAAMQFRTFSLQADRERVQVAMTQEAETPLLLAGVVVNAFRLLAHTPWMTRASPDRKPVSSCAEYAVETRTRAIHIDVESVLRGSVFDSSDNSALVRLAESAERPVQRIAPGSMRE